MDNRRQRFTGIMARYNAAIMYWIEPNSVGSILHGRKHVHRMGQRHLSYSPTTDATLRLNRFMGNNWAINSSSQRRRNNYWGHGADPIMKALIRMDRVRGSAIMLSLILGTSTRIALYCPMRQAGNENPASRDCYLKERAWKRLKKKRPNVISMISMPSYSKSPGGRGDPSPLLTGLSRMQAL